MGRKRDTLSLSVTSATKDGGVVVHPAFKDTLPELQLHRLSPQNRKQLLQLCLARAWEEVFIGPMMPRRFDAYAKNLGWRISASHQEKKNKAAERGFIRQGGTAIPVSSDVRNPNIWTGNTRKMVLSTTRVKTSGTSSQAKAEIRFEVPTYVKQQRGSVGRSITLNTLQTVTYSEAKSVWNAFIRWVLSEQDRFTVAVEGGRGKLQPARSSMAEFGTRTGTRRTMIQPRSSGVA